MPTGYTADVADGKLTDFRTFALRCARAMGACVTMRDDSLDKLPPERFEPSDYYAKAAARAEAELARLKAMTPEQIAAACEAFNRGAQSESKRYRLENTERRNRYNAMLRKVMEWTPPTPEHEGLKTFMVDQLTESRRFDDYSPTPSEPLTPEVWHARRIAAEEQNIRRTRQAQQEEEERVASRNRWLSQLRESI